MPVTEFAILPLTHNLTSTTQPLPSTLLAKLQTAKQTLETASGHSFNFLQQLEDPSILYILGTWDSVQAHEVFLPSPENQALLESLKDDILTTGDKKMELWHLSSELLAPTQEGEKSVLSAPVISLNRHFVPTDKRDGFAAKFEEVKGELQEYTKPYAVRGGWRIEKQEREEWVLCSGFESVESHHGFAKTEGFERYRGIVDFVEGFEVRHARVLEL